MTNKDTFQKKYDQARGNLLLMIVFTLVNIALIFTQSGTMFLFSAAIPYWSAIFGYIFEISAFYIVSAIVILIYLLCWLFSKKHFAWFIPALILFALDIIFLGYITIDMGDGANIIDIIIHIWVIYYIIIGIYYGFKLKKLPNEAFEAESITTDEAISEASVPLYPAEDIKHRIFVEADYGTHHICYRSVKGTNELVINGYVYGTYKQFVEPAHSLSAKVDGLDITVGYDGKYNSYINVNGQQIKKKVRLY